MVLDVPPTTDKTALFGSGIDSWEVPLVDVGPTGMKFRRRSFLRMGIPAGAAARHGAINK